MNATCILVEITLLVSTWKGHLTVHVWRVSREMPCLKTLDPGVKVFVLQ